MTDNEKRTCETPKVENKRVALTDEQLQEVTGGFDPMKFDTVSTVFTHDALKASSAEGSSGNALRKQ